ncbi:hypothetical protein U9M48_002427 [Paspalum notatum var. saurae]|uniref:Protein kinase domain-containing protein n=1 Tax=Paspalum notatum var. saurae TaxID=547442 RepID=A0AAQ3SJ22_PASNO
MATPMRIVLRVDLSNDSHKKKAFRALSDLSEENLSHCNVLTTPGIDSITVDRKGHKLTVIGCVDSIDVVCKLRKCGFTEHILSVGPLLEEKKEEKKKYDYKKAPAACETMSYPLPQYRELTLEFLNRITNNFSQERIIGCDRHGPIYKGIQDNGECMAVRKLHLKRLVNEQEFKNDFINKLSRVQHQHTIHLIGYCHHIANVRVEHNGEYVSARVEERALCFEYLQGESLDKHLSDEPCGLPWHICYGIIRGICEGLRYLHKGLEHPIYHLDLNPSNILLDRHWNMMPKIGGFGLSRLYDSLETNNISEDMETSVYMPPEYIDRQEISPKFHVFSLGVIIIQIMAGKKSYPKCADTPPDEFIHLVHEFWAKGTKEIGWRDNSREVRACIEIALKCVKSDRMLRPTITDILDKLNKIYIADFSSIEQLYWTRVFTFEFLDRITNKFSEQNKIGSGGFGVVYKGVLDSGEEIAVKKVHQTLRIDEELFKNELNNLMRVQHKNIVQLVGYCHHTEEIIAPYEGKLVSAILERKALCLEYLQGGSLDEHLSDEACRLDWDRCYKIIKGICEGLHYLHNGSDRPIFHLDLKPANILLDKDMTPKIGDFGLSKLLDSMKTYVTQSQDVIGTRGYMPPEYINSQKISSKFDVFSLGVIIIQMMAGKEGYVDCAETPTKEFIKLVHENWRKRLKATTMSYHASQEVRTCIEMALRCVEADRSQRPTISEIVNELRDIGTAKICPIDQGQKKLTAWRTCYRSLTSNICCSS